MIRNTSPNTLLRLIKPYNYLKAVIRTKVHLGLNKKCRCSNEDKFHHITAHFANHFVTKKISPIRRCIDILKSDQSAQNEINAKKQCSLNSCTHILQCQNYFKSVLRLVT